VSAAPAPKGAAGLEGGATVPRHVAIIMDGNGRWAQSRGLPRVAGHKAGAEAIRPAIETAVRYGVEALTLYAFSSENWRRSEEEVSDLKSLMAFFLDRELARLAAEGARIRIIGDYSAFGPKLVDKIDNAIERTAANDRITVVAALNYGSRIEIVSAARQLAQKVAAGELDPGQIDEPTFAAQLQTHDLPELDLLIRTSGEVRLSNFLLWQAAYAELMFLDTLWPDFDAQAFAGALDRYAARDRRFGGR
jgi:undecaprenyl diphosphate synthase